MQKIKKVTMGVAALAALAFGGAQIAGAASGSTAGSSTGEQSHGGDAAVTGAAAGKAKAAAIKAVGGGTAQDVRTENEGSAIYEVEVVNGGKTTEVLLDKAFAVVKQQADDKNGNGDRDGDAN